MQSIRSTSSQIERESARASVGVCASYEETCDVSFECCQSYMSVIIQGPLYFYVARARARVCVCVGVCLYGIWMRSHA
jgi:hypothetical protein